MQGEGSGYLCHFALLACLRRPFPACFLETTFLAKDEAEAEVDTYLKRTYGGIVKSCEVVEREDLDLVNKILPVPRQR